MSNVDELFSFFESNQQPSSEIVPISTSTKGENVESGQRAQKLLQEILTQDAQLNPSTDSDNSASTIPKFDLTQVPLSTIADNAPETKRSRVDESASSSAQVVENSGGDPNSALEYTTERVDLGMREEELPRIQIYEIEAGEGCTHEVAVPPGVELVPLVVTDRAPAKEYSFVLDPFQRQAILCVENTQSVLLAAHTSAGKTAVAEYAIASALRDRQRVIYTSPIKALSNQKYREFFDEFHDVGLMTGDVTINPTAACLVMTTEILRSMLYRGSEVMREVSWVIFDEIHYMRDKERGVVWEETIILLPDNVRFVFLSATIPNARQFAEWVAHLHRQPCHVVYTDYRPVPLQHYIYPCAGEGIHLIVDDRSNFLQENFQKAMSSLSEEGDSRAGGRRARNSKPIHGRRSGAESDVFKLVKMCTERDFAPAIVFSFSRKDCEAYALEAMRLDLNSNDEKKLVEEVFKNAIDTLSPEDQHLPQIAIILPYLKKGVGIHHSGLLPILKETIEILFGEGLIKVLFATETFSMGLNMPARTVLFSTMRKFDGRDFRSLTSGEYVQMSGRAGRRGIDKRGVVIMIAESRIDPDVYKNIAKGKPDPLNSAFHLTYNMILNLMRVEEINPEYMLERSFFQFQALASVPELLQKAKKFEEEYRTTRVDREEDVCAYHRLKTHLHQLQLEFQSYIHKPRYVLPFLQPGRLVRITIKKEDRTPGLDDLDFGWGVVINFNKKGSQDNSNPALLHSEPQYILDCLLYVTKDSLAEHRLVRLKPCNYSLGFDKSSNRRAERDEEGEFAVVPVDLVTIAAVSAVRLMLPQDLRPFDNRKVVFMNMKEVQKRYLDKDGLPLLNPVEDMNIKEPAFLELVKKLEAFEERLLQHPIQKDPKRNKLYEAYLQKQAKLVELQSLRQQLRAKRSLIQMEELKKRKRILRRLGYCNADEVILTKGRIACEISAADELLLTELLFSGVFNELSPAQCAALISCFAFQEKVKEIPELPANLAGPFRTLTETARRIAQVSRDSKIDLDEDDYLNSFKPHMMKIVFAWASGSSFKQICEMSETIFEGSVIRAMRRIEESLREMSAAAKAIGSADLEAKFAQAITLIKRDIVFAASLYL